MIENYIKRSEISPKDKNLRFWENWKKKIPEIFRILGVVTDLQVDFLNEHQLLATFCDLISIELIKVLYV